MWQRSILAVTLFLVGSAAYSQQYYGRAPCGVDMFISENPQGASATVWQGAPVIIIDPSQIGHPLWQPFLIAHECAHHLAGHSTPNGMWFRRMTTWATGQQELEADCFAARNVSIESARYAANLFVQGGPMPSAPGYPSGFQRAQNIARCAGL